MKTNRLFKTLDNPLEREVLGESILDELYFRLICDDPSGSLQRLLRHRGQVQKIFKTVNYVHNIIGEVFFVDKLASLANLIISGFRKRFCCERVKMQMKPGIWLGKTVWLNSDGSTNGILVIHLLQLEQELDKPLKKLWAVH